MQKVLLICCLLLSVTFLYGQTEYVIGSPICPSPIEVIDANGEKQTLFPGGDNTFHYLLTEENLPCIKVGNQYFYASYKDGKAEASNYKLGAIRSSVAKEQLQAQFLAHQNQMQKVQKRLKAMHLTPSVKSIGEINILLILVEYSDKAHTTSKAAIEAMFNEPGTAEQAGFKEFYQRASHGRLNVNVDVAGWYNCGQPYSNFSESKGMYLTGNLVRKAVDAAEEDGIDFSKYDNDGDGKADAIMVMHAGLGADHRGEEQYIWPHSWSLSSTVEKAVNYDGVRVDPYVIACERRVYSGVNQAAGIGTFAHEFGHALGLPDMYDGTGKSNGLGHWAMMSAGSWLDGGYRPSNFCAWSRYNLGWEEPTVISYNDVGTYTLASMNQEADQLLRINTKSDDQYFLIENRRAELNDVRQPASGLAIYQISKSKLALERSINDNRDFPAIRLLEADFNKNGGLYGAKDRGVAADLFAGDDETITVGAATSPSTNLFNGRSSGVELSTLTLEDDYRFSFRVEGPVPLISWSNKVFKESPLNDGSINESIRVQLEGDEFVYNNGVLPSEAWQVSNLPEGFSIVFNEHDATTLDIELEGYATNHESDNNISNLMLSFTDAAFKSLGREEIQSSEGNALSLKFLDEEAGIRLYMEDFEGVTPPEMPAGWERPDASNGSATHWETVYGSNHTTGGSIGVQFYDKNADNKSFWLISPLIDLKDYNNVSLSFWQKFDLKGDAKNKVAISTDKENWTTIYDDHPEKNDQWEEATAVIPDKFLGESVYLGFCIYEEQAWGWFWDDVSLVVTDNNAIYEIEAKKDPIAKYDDVLQTISVTSPKEPAYISVYNISGQRVMQRNNTKQVSVSQLTSGIYIVEIRMKDNSVNIIKFKK
jgi:M6 family metalloprotease-like protein